MRGRVVQVGRRRHREDRLQVRWTLDRSLQLGHREVADADHADVAVAPGLRSRPLHEVVHVAAFLRIEEAEGTAGTAGPADVGDHMDVAAGHPEIGGARLDEARGGAEVLHLPGVRRCGDQRGELAPGVRVVHVGQQSGVVAHGYALVDTVGDREPGFAEVAVGATGVLRAVQPTFPGGHGFTLRRRRSLPAGSGAQNSHVDCEIGLITSVDREEGSTCMSGHSKWATTKHKKAIIDARRGKNFAKLIKNIEVAARTGGGDPGGNPTLYDAIQKAKKSSVPNDNIERARKRGAGEEAGGADWQTITYEGYGPNGVAVLVECLTDNRNRAAGEVRVAMTRNGGNMADPGSVSYLFTRKGVVTLEKNDLTEDDVLTAVLEAGAEDVNDLGESFEIISEPTDLVAVRTALQEAGIDYDSAEASFQPSVTVPVDLEGARKVLKLVDALEDSDDVQDVYTNIEIPDDVAAALDED
jgi:YebC/PmpR family DNA-binding regulatory protein